MRYPIKFGPHKGKYIEELSRAELSALYKKCNEGTYLRRAIGELLHPDNAIKLKDMELTRAINNMKKKTELPETMNFAEL